MTAAGRSLIVIGYGNPGRLDDGLGPAFADRVEALRLPGVTVDSNYQLNVEDAATIAKHDVVLFVDAALYSADAYYLKRIEPEMDVSFCSHSVSPGQVYNLAQSLFNAETQAFVLGIRGFEFNEFGERLSEKAKANLEQALMFFQTLAEQNWNFEANVTADEPSPAEELAQGEEDNE